MDQCANAVAEEYLSLLHLHLWRSEVASSTELELIFDDELRLLFACRDHVPDIASANVDLLDKIGKKGSRYCQEATDGIFALFGESMKMMMGMDYTSLSAVSVGTPEFYHLARRPRNHPTLIVLIILSWGLGAAGKPPADNTSFAVRSAYRPAVDSLSTTPLGTRRTRSPLSSHVPCRRVERNSQRDDDDTLGEKQGKVGLPARAGSLV